jgi:hypothetical protein
MRLVALAVSITLMLLPGCDHMGGAGRGFGHAASGFARTTERAASGVARATAPIALRIARVAPVIARDAIIVAAVAAQLSEPRPPADVAGPPAAQGPLAASTRPPDGADPCSDCPSDETCFYVDYMCPATTPPAPVDP